MADGGAYAGGGVTGGVLTGSAVIGRCGGTTPGCVVIGGFGGAYGAAGMARRALGCAAPCAIGAGAEAGRCGKGASSEIFWVGATRGPDAPSLAPQPPQNRESGAFSVPQLAQRIPSQA